MQNGTPRTFSTSQQTLEYLADKYGIVDYSRWQALRREWYSYVNYPAAGGTQFNFFGDVNGQPGFTLQDTNMQKAGTFGQTHFLLKQIELDLRVPDPKFDQAIANDADALYSDFIAGFIQAGVLEIRMSGRVFNQIPRPFLFCPPADGQLQVRTAGIRSMVLADGAPNTFTSAVVAPPHASLRGGRVNGFIMDPNLLIEAEQSIQVQLLYGNAVPVISTNVEDSSSNPYSIGCILSGIAFRPTT